MADGLLNTASPTINPRTGVAALPMRSEPLRHGDVSFRADTDQSGEWYVWTRLGAARNAALSGGGFGAGSGVGWATMQRCESRELAQRLADDLNQRSLRVAV